MFFINFQTKKWKQMSHQNKPEISQKKIFLMESDDFFAFIYSNSVVIIYICFTMKLG